jgi:hypothetical protein
MKSGELKFICVNAGVTQADLAEYLGLEPEGFRRKYGRRELSADEACYFENAALRLAEIKAKEKERMQR